MPVMQETWIRSLGEEDPLEKEMATHSSTLAWKIPWTQEPGRLQSMESQRETSLSLSNRSIPIIGSKTMTNWALFLELIR